MLSNGCTFKELVKSSTLNNDDILLVSTHDENGNLISKAISIQSLAKQLNDELDQQLNIGTISYCNQNEYATSQHDHDIFTSADYINQLNDNVNAFNMLSIIKYYPNSERTQTETSILKIEIKTAQTSGDAKWEKTIEDAQPKVGTISLAAVNDISSYALTNITSYDFIGWVPANGDTYALSNFLLSNDICLMYGNDDNETFSVPNLNSFCKMQNQISSSASYENGYDEVPLHSHQISYENSTIAFSNLTQENTTPKSIKLITRYSNNEATHTNPYRKIHAGESKIKGYIQLTSTQDINSSTFKQTKFTTPYDGIDISDDYWQDGAYPAYNRLPVLIYIGRSRNSAPLTATTNS